ncbi:MAG: hypothetical protein Kow0074_25840 [Candidatus Zixiibacteriota bacterium]
MTTSTHKWAVVLVGLSVILMTASSADARVKYRERHHRGIDYTQRGFQLYAGFGGQGYEIQNRNYDFLREHESDGMFFLGAAVGLDRNLALYLEGSGSEHDTPIGPVDFGYLHLGLKYAFQTGYAHPWQPYGKLSAGAMYLHERYFDRYAAHYDEDDNGYVGPSLGLGFGVDRFISRRAAIFGEIGFLFGRFDQRIIDGHEYDLYDDVGVSSGRIQFGLRLRL